MRAAEKVLWALAAAGTVLGIFGLVQRFTGGHVEAAYGSFIPWGLWVAIYAMLIGMSAGSFILAAAVHSLHFRELTPAARLALPLALATFIGGILAIWLDLGHPFRAWKLLLSTGFSSVMGWMAWFYLAYFLALCLLFWMVLVRRQDGAGSVRALGIVGILLALLFGGGEGALFGVVGARPFWQSGMTPVLFILEGLLSGTALVTFVTLLLEDTRTGATVTLGRLILGLLGLSILFEWAELSIGYYASIPAYADGLRLMLFGQFAWVFWGVHLGLGTLLPLALLLWAGRSRWAVATAAALVASTALSTKLNVVIPGLAVPEIQGLQDAYTGPGLSFQYFPTVMEWLVGLWIMGVAGLIFLAVYRLVAGPAAQTRGAEKPALQG